MKRQSTVAKLSSTLLRQLVQFCKAYNCGIILRVSGVEYGYDAAQLEFTFGSILSGRRSANKFFDMIGSVVPCIRKGWNDFTNLGPTVYSELTDSEFWSIVLGGPVSLSNEFSVFA